MRVGKPLPHGITLPALMKAQASAWCGGWFPQRSATCGWAGNSVSRVARCGDSAPLLAGKGSLIGRQHLDADVVGAGCLVFGDPAHDGRLVTPGDDRIEEPIAHL